MDSNVRPPDFFKLEFQWKHHLIQAKIDPDKTSPMRLNEIKKAFFGGISEVLVMIIEMPTSETQGIEIQDGMLTQGLRHLANANVHTPIPNNAYDLQSRINQFFERIKLVNGPAEQVRIMTYEYVAGWVQMLLLIRDHISSLPDEVAEQTLQDLLDQSKKFWTDQTIHFYLNHNR